MSKAISSLSVGDKIEVPVFRRINRVSAQKIVFKVADKNHSGYPSNSVTLITERLSSLCVQTRKSRATATATEEITVTTGIFIQIYRAMAEQQRNGGNWYSAKHSADAPPTNANVWDNYNEYDAWAGFLAMLDPKFVAELLDTTLTVVKSSTDGGSYETFTAKMFLRLPPKWGLQTKTGSPKACALPCSATTLPASPILRQNA